VEIVSCDQPDRIDLRELEARLTALRELCIQWRADDKVLDDLRWGTHAEAEKLAREALSVRLDNLNHSHATIKEAQVNYVRREYYDMQHETLREQVRTLEGEQATLRGKASMTPVVVGWALGLAGIIIAIWGHWE
jgi:hypothetical protein